MTTPRTRCVVYRRVSTDEQAASGLGLDAQLEAATAYANRLGLEVAGVYTDAGVSGGAPLDSCYALLCALDALEPGDRLVVAKRDRLGRDALRCATIERLVNRAGATVESAAGEGNGDGPADLLMRRMVDAFAEYERQLISARTRAAMRAKRARGESTGNPPFGYVARPDGKLAPLTGEIDVARAAVEARERGLSTRRIAVELTERGWRSRNGGAISHTAVQRMLNFAREHDSTPGAREARA